MSVRGQMVSRDQRCVLVETDRWEKEDRFVYFKLGLALGQSRFLVEDPLRDDVGALLPCCHVLEDPLATALRRAVCPRLNDALL